jgi:hypothetical protein
LSKFNANKPVFSDQRDVASFAVTDFDLFLQGSMHFDVLPVKPPQDSKKTWPHCWLTWLVHSASLN